MRANFREPTIARLSSRFREIVWRDVYVFERDYAAYEDLRRDYHKRTETENVSPRKRFLAERQTDEVNGADDLSTSFSFGLGGTDSGGHPSNCVIKPHQSIRIGW